MNKLKNENSLYLQQHANNPVNWYHWGNDALATAKKQDKLVIISIGYSSCHWCHVMEKESFENHEVAEVMNDHFISIKVDREERPDVDHTYMDALHLMGHQGGWPLNIVALPDGRPVWGGTYFKKAQWINALLQLKSLYQSEPEKMEEYAVKLANAVKASSNHLVKLEENQTKLNFENLARIMSESFDTRNGGFSAAPKFPMPVVLKSLITTFKPDEQNELSEFAILTLLKMARGGIYDQVGGGFARYSVDAIWKVPHFEKMLYDNAQLLSVYAMAYKTSPNSRFKQIIDGTINWLCREMKTNDGFYASALDADSQNGIEGDFYSYTYQEIEQKLGKDAQLAIKHWQITQNGNWEHGRNILMPANDELIHKEQAWAKHLLDYRINSKSAPAKDCKAIFSWNSMLVTGFLLAYEATGENRYLELGKELFSALNNKVDELGYVPRLVNAIQLGFLDDYAHYIEACIMVYQHTGSDEIANHAKETATKAISLFRANNGDLLWYAPNLPDSAFANKIEIQDNVIPSANSVMAINFFLLSRIFGLAEFDIRAEAMLNKAKADLQRHPIYYANWHTLALYLQDFSELVVAGIDSNKQFEKALKMPWHNRLIVTVNKKVKTPVAANKFKLGETLVYLCKGNNCNLPQASLELVEEFGKFTKSN
ncbi:MAG: thioredoxin domain-containing protein [Bacteroidetes bacterium]|nr:thioredoxin domain-containing protein [Bacteroidota bacterium]